MMEGWARLGVERPVNGYHRSLFRVFGTVFQRDIQLAARLDAFIPVLAGLLDPFLLGDGKVDADGIDGGYDGEGAAFRADQVAYIRLGNAGDSVKGGIQHRIGKILFSQGQGRRGLLHLRFRGNGGEARILVLLLGNGVLRGQGLVNLRVIIQLLELGLRLFQRGFGLGDLVLEGGIVNAEKHLPLLHNGAVGVILRLQVARDLGNDGGVVHAVQMAHPASRHRDVHGNRLFVNKRGRFMRHLFRLFTPGKKEGEQEEENGGTGDRARQACQVHAVNDTPAASFVERRLSGRQRRPCHAGGFSPG